MPNCKQSDPLMKCSISIVWEKTWLILFCMFFYTTLLWLSIFDSVGLITLTFTKAPFLPNIKQREFALILFKQTWRGSHYGNESRTMSSFLQTILTSVMQKQRNQKF